MKKGISKEQILNTAIELMREKNDIRSANIRILAREIGCAHTNIYNYYSSLDTLFIEAYQKVQEIFIRAIITAVSSQRDNNAKLEKFFSQIIDFYLNNKGWFRLLWFENFGEDQKEGLYKIASRTVNILVSIMEDILINPYDMTPERVKIKKMIHVIHCYIYGEISIYMSNHSFVQYTSFLGNSQDIPDLAAAKDEESFKLYIRDEAIKILNMYLKEGER